MRLFNILSIAILTLATPASAQELPAKPEIRVALEIAGESGIDATVRASLARELRKIDEVVIFDQNPYYKISVIAMKGYTVSGEHRGYILSVVVLLMAPAENLKNLAESRKDPDLTFLSNVMKNQGIMVDHHVQSIGPSDKDLEDGCRKIASVFDGKQIEGTRQLYQLLKDQKKQTPKSK